MNKKPILSKHPKKFIVFLLVCLITITLAGCDSSNKAPTDDINLNATYASVGDYKVTVGEVYNKLRYNAVEYLESQVYNIIYQEEIKTLKDDLYNEDDTVNKDSKYLERLENEILTDIYGVYEDDEIEELSDKEQRIAVEEYVDNMYKKGYLISKDDVKAKKFSSIYPFYYLEVAKYIAAENKLKDEFEVEDGKIKFGEITDESYFTKDDVVEWYENNYENTGEVTAILIRFINNEEINEILKKFGLKQSGGNWYQIKLDADDTRWETKNGYDKYYDEYKIDLSSDQPLTAVDKYGNGNATILKIYAAIYNYVYAPTNEAGEYVYRNPIVLDDTVKINNADGHLKYYRYIQNILEKDKATREADLNNTEYDDLLAKLAKHEEANDETIVMGKEKLDKYSTSLANYVYNDLKTKADENGKTFTQYSTTGKSFGSYYYLVYKIAQKEIEQEETTKLFEETETEDGKKEITFLNEEFLNEILLEMFEDELSDTYVNDAFTERVKEVELKIYDSIIESQFMNSSTSSLVESYKKNKKENNKFIAEVTYKGKTENISVKDLYSYLEPLNGPTVASNLLFQQYIENTDYYKDLTDNHDEYVETIKIMLYYFANDYYASSGYPSTIGKYDFMMLYFGTADVEEAVKFLMLSEAMNAYFSDFTEHGLGSSDTFYTKLRDYALETYNNFYSLTASGLTVYVDRDEDGVADDIENVKTEAKNLLEFALNEVAHSNKDYSTALNDIVSDYNSSSRIDDENPTTPESKWAEFRKLGLHIKVSSYSTITNTTETVDDAIKTRVQELYSKVVDPVLGFTSAYLDDKVLTTEENELTTLLITGGTLPTSALFESDDEETNKLYEEVKVVIGDKQVIIPLDYSSKEITEAQVKAYVAEYILVGDVHSLPSSTTAALDAYLLPLITKYTGSASQQKLVSLELGTINYEYNGDLSDSFNDEFKAEYAEIGRAGFVANYNTILQNSEDGYDSQYPNWWNDMYQKVQEGGNN